MSKKLMFAAAVMMLAALSMAQGGPGGGRRGGGYRSNSPEGLISRSDVQADLNLTDDQKTQITQILGDARTAAQARMQGVDLQSMSEADRAKMRADGEKANQDTDAKIDGVLTSDQQARILGIYIQLNGNSAILNKKVAAKLGLTDSQVAQIKKLRQEQQANQADIQQQIQSGAIDRSQARPLMQKNRDVMNTALGNLLTDSQKSELKTLAGATFTPDPNIRGGGFGGGFGGGGGRRNGGGGAAGG